MKTTSTTFARPLAVALAAVTATGALAFSPAIADVASGGGGGNSSGQCSTISGWTLEAKAAGTGIQVRADVLSKELDSIWKWKLFDNGRRFAKGKAIMDKERRDFTYFEVQRTTTDQSGTDTIRFVATQTVTGEVCDGSLPV